MPVADIRNSAKDDAFVHFIVELRVYVHTQLRLVSYFILHLQGFFYSSFRNKIYFSAVFFFFLCAVCLFGLLFTILLTLPCRRISKTCFSDSHRPSTLGKNQLKPNFRSQALGVRFIEILIFLKMECYFTLFVLRINMECSSSCISHFFAARAKCLNFPCRVKSCEDKGASPQSCQGLR